jgi:hypothetical protein
MLEVNMRTSTSIRGQETIYFDITETAKILREELKKHWPTVKFSVRCDRYSMGSSIDVKYNDGPPQKAVEAVVKPFVGSTFDGMQDLKSPRFTRYKINGVMRDVHFGGDFIHVRRNHTPEGEAKIKATIKEKYGFDWSHDMDFQPGVSEQLLNRGFRTPWHLWSTVANEVDFTKKNGHKPIQTTEQKEVEYTITETSEKGGVEVKFPSHPGDAICFNLSSAGFRWSRFARVWWIKPQSEEHRTEIVNNLRQMLSANVASQTEQTDTHTIDKARADKLRRLADGMQSQIDKKRNPAIANQVPTARRARIAAGMEEDAKKLEEIQSILRGMADSIENETLPEILNGVTTKAVVENLVYFRDFPNMNWGEKEREQLIKAGIHCDADFQKAKQAIKNLAKPVSGPSPVEIEIKRKERELLGLNIPGYFPTPREIVEKMLDLSGIRDGMTVLEPSAGKGNICDVIKEKYNVELSVIEYQTRLQEILKLKGYNVIGHDFLEHTGQWDLIIQNPPFEDNQDIQHVRHAYSCLKEGGRLVSIMSEGPFFRNDKQAVAFREWLDDLGGYSEKLPSGAFKMSGTGVSTRIVVIDK